MDEDLWDLMIPSSFCTGHKDWFLSIAESTGIPSNEVTQGKALGHREPQFGILEEYTLKES